MKIFIVAATLLLLASLGTGLLAAYWFVPEPHLASVSMETVGQALNQPLVFKFDRPVNRSQLTKQISPEVPGTWQFEDPLIPKHLYRKLVFYPHDSLRPETQYQITLTSLTNTLKLANPYGLEFIFTTQDVPEIVQVIVPGGETTAALDQPFVVKLSAPNDRVSLFEFELNPAQTFEATLDETKTEYRLVPQSPLKAGTNYELTLKRTNLTWNLVDNTITERSPTSNVYQAKFTTQGTPELAAELGPVQVESISPRDGWTAVAVSSPLKVTFNQAVEHASAQERFTVSPAIEGSFSWDGNTLIFLSHPNLAFSTKYKVSLSQGIKSRFGQDSTDSYQADFTTQAETRKLGVPAYLQQHALSCEVASLRMALAYRGIQVSEEELLAQVGIDWTPHAGNVWGDPTEKFVGNVDGKQMIDGYGVHWGPIARIARNYRQASEFENWSIGQMTEALANNNPVIIWTYAGGGTPTTWKTPSGKEIYAVRDEHTVVMAGFVGPADNPSQLIVNDPLVGQVYWSRDQFERKWTIFNRSGVVIF